MYKMISYEKKRKYLYKWERLKSTLINSEINPQNVEEHCKEEDLISLFHYYENERSQLRKETKGYLAQCWI